MKSSTKKVLITSAAGVALLAAGAVPAFAAPKTGVHPGGISGTVSAVSGSTITLAGTNGTSYSVNASAASLLKGVSNAKPTKITLNDIKVGDAVAVMGPVSGTTITARVIFDGPVPAGARHMDAVHGSILAGMISTIASTTLTVAVPPHATSTATTSVTVLTNNDTKILKDGRVATFADLSVGQNILVSGTKNADGSLTATKLMVRTSAVLPDFLGHGKGKGKNHRE